MRRAGCEAVLGLVLLGAASAGDLPPLNSKNGALLPATSARGLLRQCSRAAPQNVQGVWTPTEEQIRDLEARLPGALEQEMTKRGHAAPTGSPTPVEFGRQYGGFIAGGRKVIYVSAFPLNVANQTKDWRTRAVMVCDGGEAFFGVEYDPAAKSFANFAFNGFA